MNVIHAGRAFPSTSRAHSEPFAADVGRLGLVASFVAVADTLSFADAAAETGQTSPTISRKITRLEDTLGIRLFDRTTRRVSLTEAGRLYLEHCRQALEHLSLGNQLIEGLSSAPSGKLRISMPVALGRLHLSGAIRDFMRDFPEIEVNAHYSDSFVDLIEGGYDLVIRTGILADSSLVARRLGANKRVLVASRSYLAEHPAPRKPEDLAKHECLIFERYAASGSLWHLERGDERISVKTSGRLRSDSSEAIFDAAMNGFGIGVVATYICHEQLRRGELVEVLPDWQLSPEAGIYVAFPNSRHVAPKVRAFADFMAHYFRDAPWEAS
ncbi:LysR family transcriptional regulator [Pseudooceanicola sp. CBS1P-1]|nr:MULTISPECIES: LysR family transcriptional regulator [Pseudooceanicola]MBT9386577.1 LysR family transcriptional regulator [Pseudooceanicola endophyticus]